MFEEGEKYWEAFLKDGWALEPFFVSITFPGLFFIKRIYPALMRSEELVRVLPWVRLRSPKQETLLASQL